MSPFIAVARWTLIRADPIEVGGLAGRSDAPSDESSNSISKKGRSRIELGTGLGCGGFPVSSSFSRAIERRTGTDKAELQGLRSARMRTR